MEQTAGRENGCTSNMSDGFNDIKEKGLFTGFAPHYIRSTSLQLGRIGKEQYHSYQLGKEDR